MKRKANYMQETKVRIQTSHVIQTLKAFITEVKLTEGNETHKAISSSNNPMHKQFVELILRNANANEEHQVNQEYQRSEKSSAYFEKA